MGTALFTGVTGLKAQQRKLDVVANNIANVNTTGYRASRVLFQDLFSQTLRGGSAPLGGFGGSNPQQVGLGVQLASIDVDHGQGSLVTTGVPTDLAIQGNGFFVLNNGQGNIYTRDGSFLLNADGVLIDPATGLRVQGFVADEDGIIEDTGSPSDIAIPLGGLGIVQPTSAGTMIGNLNPTITGDVPLPKTVTRSVTVYDSLGTERDVTLTFVKSQTDNNTWTVTAGINGNTNNVNIDGALGGRTLTFDSAGALIVPADGVFDINVPAALITNSNTAPSDMNFSLDFTQVTQLANGDLIESDISLQNQNGFGLGSLESVNVGSNGDINGVFSNGLTRTLARVALATFANVGGLERAGNNSFRETPASGAAQIGVPSTGGRGSAVGGVLESSNVDLGTQFSELIITQRGFQANARTITAADTLLQETVNLVR
jgi:flagellar hook protein FlgE